MTASRPKNSKYPFTIRDVIPDTIGVLLTDTVSATESYPADVATRSDVPISVMNIMILKFAAKIKAAIRTIKIHHYAVPKILKAVVLTGLLFMPM